MLSVFFLTVMQSRFPGSGGHIQVFIGQPPDQRSRRKGARAQQERGSVIRWMDFVLKNQAHQEPSPTFYDGGHRNFRELF